MISSLSLARISSLNFLFSFRPPPIFIHKVQSCLSPLYFAFLSLVRVPLVPTHCIQLQLYTCFRLVLSTCFVSKSSRCFRQSSQWQIVARARTTSAETRPRRTRIRFVVSKINIWLNGEISRSTSFASYLVTKSSIEPISLITCMMKPFADHLSFDTWINYFASYFNDHEMLCWASITWLLIVNNVIFSSLMMK